jgi:hypothetical protein
MPSVIVRCLVLHEGEYSVPSQQSKQGKPPQSQEKQLLQLRWVAVIFLIVVTLVAIAVPIVVFCLTKSLYSFSGFSFLGPLSYLWHRFAKFYLFPMDERTFQLKKLKIEMEAQRKNNKLSP